MPLKRSNRFKPMFILFGALVCLATTVGCEEKNAVPEVTKNELAEYKQHVADLEARRNAEEEESDKEAE